MNPQELLNAVIHSGSRTAVITLREQFRDSTEMSDLWDWFDGRFILASQNRERLNAIEPETIEPIPLPQNSWEHAKALDKFLNGQKIAGYWIREILYDQTISSEHHHTSLMLPTDGVEGEETKERLAVILNRHFPRIKGVWDVFCQNWPMGEPRLIEIANMIPHGGLVVA